MKRQKSELNVLNEDEVKVGGFENLRVIKSERQAPNTLSKASWSF